MTDQEKPEIANYGGYGKSAPNAAKFNVGTHTGEGAAAAQEARRRHGRDIAARTNGPSSK